MNTTMDKLAIGARFQFEHNRKGDGLTFIKVSNRFSIVVGEEKDGPGPNYPESWTDEQVANDKVTYLGRSDNSPPDQPPQAVA